jgi:ABC-type polysaccharide/polyol phosphate transport system ATPase subunit
MPLKNKYHKLSNLPYCSNKQDTAIVVHNVCKRFHAYEHKTASLRELFMRVLKRSRVNERQPHFSIEDVSLSIGFGVTAALVGPNGAGKSTLLRLMAGIYWPSNGQVVTRGKVAVIIELASGFHPELTGRENVFVYGSILGLNRNVLSRLYDQIVEFAGLDEFMETPVKYYSTGMRMRLGFSIATCVQPDILLLDEILAVGDTEFNRKCLERLRLFQDAGCAIVVATHDMDTAIKFATHAVWIDHGRIQMQDTSEKVISAYKAFY